MFWMSWAEANPIAFWLLFLSALALGTCVATAWVERPRPRRRFRR